MKEPLKGMRKKSSKSYKISKMKKTRTTKMINKNIERQMILLAKNAN
jgi:hypothetical protein